MKVKQQGNLGIVRDGAGAEAGGSPGRSLLLLQ